MSSYVYAHVGESPERKAWLEEALAELLPPAIAARMRKYEGPLLSSDARRYVLGTHDYSPRAENPKKLVDAVRSVVSQWSADGKRRTVRAAMWRTKRGGYKCAGDHDEGDAPCFLCGDLCGQGGRFECVQGTWLESCRSHAHWDKAMDYDDVDCIYSCDECMHGSYKLGEFSKDCKERVRMTCGCLFLFDAMSRMGD